MGKKSASNNVKFAMSGIKSGSTRRAKKQENTTHNEETNQSVETGPEILQMVELVEQDIKTRYCKYYKSTQYVQEDRGKA